jgi:hypothetical protein
MKRGILLRYAANLSLVLALVAIWGTDGPARGSSTPPARGLGTAAPNPVQPIVKEMKDAQSRLKGGDTGPGTRGVQEHVVRDLDKLIEAAARQSDSSRGSRQPQSEAKSPQESQNGSPEEGKAQQKSGSLGPPSNTAGSEPGRTNGKRQPRAITAIAVPGHSSLAREVWGHLPPAVRENVRVDFSETVLPAYDELVRRYFEALLEEQSQPGPASSPGNRAAGPTR